MRESVVQQLGKGVLVLTSLESKGLEFDVSYQQAVEWFQGRKCLALTYLNLITRQLVWPAVHCVPLHAMVLKPTCQQGRLACWNHIAGPFSILQVLTCICTCMRFLQVVVAYNFFSQSVLADGHKWRLLYQYLAARNLLPHGATDTGGKHTAPAFDAQIHRALSTELKIFYVVGTRARKDLVWVEHDVDAVQPVLDAWTLLGASGTQGGDGGGPLVEVKEDADIQV